MILFVDNDVILKLTACDLFWEAIACLGFQNSDIKVLSSAKFVFEGSKVKKNYSEQVRQREIAIVKKLTQVNATPDNQLIAVDCKGLDEGELILMGEAIKEPCFYLVTGDKKCMRALMKCPELKTAKHKFMGRFICLEQLIIRLIEEKGFDFVKEKVTPMRECDKALKVAFGSGLLSTKSNSLLALNDNIDEIDRDCPNLLVQTRNQKC